MTRRNFLVLVIFILIQLFIFQASMPSLEGNSQGQISASSALEKWILDLGIDQAKIKFAEMLDSNLESYSFEEKDFLALGNKLRSTGRVEAAIEVFKIMIEIFPKSPQAWFNLGKAYIRILQREQVVESYQKAIELDANNTDVKAEMGWIEMRLTNARYESREPVKFEPGTNTGLKGPYLGQKPPGLKPEKFAPGIVSVYGSNENTITFSPDGKEIYFGREPGIWASKLTPEGWSAPEKTSIDGYEMHISRWTGTMYYTGYSEAGIYAMKRQGDLWGEPKQLLKSGMFSSVTQDEAIYTCVFSGSVKVGRYLKTDNGYGEAEVFGKEINSSGFDAHPNIYYDESFLVFDSQLRKGNGFSNLFISFRKEDNTWCEAIYLGNDINMPGSNNCSSFSPDGKYLFYTAHNDIYWIDARILEKFRPDDLN